MLTGGECNKGFIRIHLVKNIFNIELSVWQLENYLTEELMHSSHDHPFLLLIDLSRYFPGWQSCEFVLVLFFPAILTGKLPHVLQFRSWSYRHVTA